MKKLYMFLLVSMFIVSMGLIAEGTQALEAKGIYASLSAKPTEAKPTAAKTKAQISHYAKLKYVECPRSCIIVVSYGLDAPYKINGIIQRGNGIRVVEGDVKITFSISETHRNWDSGLDPINVSQVFQNPNELTWDGEPVVTLVYIDGYGVITESVGPIDVVKYVWSPDN